MGKKIYKYFYFFIINQHFKYKYINLFFYIIFYKKNEILGKKNEIDIKK